MNYYKHHISDFNNATRYLSRIERSIYRDMLDMYYDTEAPLPLDVDLLSRRLSISPEERKSLDFILSEYFQKKGDGYHNLRADCEIREYRQFLTKQTANAKLGGRPKKTHGLAVGLPNETQAKPKKTLTNNHTPLTNNQDIHTTTPISPPSSGIEITGEGEGNQVNLIISGFKTINPSYARLYANRSERAAVVRMLETHGYDKLDRVVKYACAVAGKQYAPAITTPIQLERKFGDLMLYFSRSKAEKPMGNVTDLFGMTYGAN